MRSTCAVPMLLAGAAGCLDLSSLQSGSMGTMPKDMAMPTDGSTAFDMKTPADLKTSPARWSLAYSSTGNPLNAITGFKTGSTSTIYAAGGLTVIKGDGSAFSAAAFSPAGTAPIHGMWAGSDVNVYVSDDGGSIWETKDGAASDWLDVAAGASSAQWSIHGRGRSDILAVGLDKKFGYYFNTTWTKVQHNVNQQMYGVYATAAKWYVVGQGGGSAYATDPAMNWTAKNVGGGPALRAVYASDDQHVFAVGLGGAIHKFDGTAWSNMSQGSNDLLAIWGSSSSDIFAVGKKGTVLHYDGAQWKSDSSPALASVDLSGIWGDGSGGVWAVGNDSSGKDGSIYKY